MESGQGLAVNAVGPKQTGDKMLFDVSQVKKDISPSKAGINEQREPTENASVPREKLGQLPEDAGLIRFSSHEDLQSRAQQIVDDINAKRKRDNDLLRNFRKALETRVSNSCAAVEEEMFNMYQSQSKVIEAKLAELFSALSRISKLQNELMEFKEALNQLCKDTNTF